MADQAAPAAAASGASKRKFTRMGVGTPKNCDMGAIGAFAALKQEADNIARAGVAHVLDKEENLIPLLHNYLSGSAAREHGDAAGVEHEENNSTVYSSLLKFTNAYVDSLTGTCAERLDKEVCLNLYISLVRALKTGTDGSDGSPTFYLDAPGGADMKSHKKSGGFQKLYDSVNVPVAGLNKLEQDRCIFAMTHTHFVKMGGPAASKLYDLVGKKVAELYKVNAVAPKAVHVLFHWNSHSFFTYHQDDDGDVAAICNLSHGVAYMHVAGSEQAKYDGIGSTHIFPTKVFHRSGDAPRRSIKVAFFFSVEKEVEKEIKPEPDEDTNTNNEAGTSQEQAVHVDDDDPVPEDPKSLDTEEGGNSADPSSPGKEDEKKVQQKKKGKLKKK